jgi:hypothetical protein
LKLIRDRQSGVTSLFDVVADPGEQRDRAADPAAADRRRDLEAYAVATVAAWSRARALPPALIAFLDDDAPSSSGGCGPLAEHALREELAAALAESDAAPEAERTGEREAPPAIEPLGSGEPLAAPLGVAERAGERDTDGERVGAPLSDSVRRRRSPSHDSGSDAQPPPSCASWSTPPARPHVVSTTSSASKSRTSSAPTATDVGDG